MTFGFQKICAYPACGRRVVCRGYCQGHYKQLRKTGKAFRSIQKRAPCRPGVTRYSSVTIPPELHKVLDRLRRKLGLTRGGIVTRAVEEWADARRKG